MVRRYKVIIVQAAIKQYRESFFLKLWELLSKNGVDLTVVYSKPGRIHESKKDNIELPQYMTKKVSRIYALNDRILIQLLSVSDVIKSDLIIINQASGNIHNFPLLLFSRLGLKKVAFWGHGYNRQGNPTSLSERIKKRLVKWSSYWFAYTHGTARYLVSVGVPSDKITSIENSIDTKGFRDLLDSVTSEEIFEKRRQLGISKGDCVGLYCGSLYTEKKIIYLLNVAKRIAAIEPRFRLLIVGSGIEEDIVQRASKDNSYILYTGPLFGRDKAISFRMAEIFLNPGMVGLGILDSFVAGLPFLTTSEGLHSPEIDYLNNTVNGLMVSGNEEAFAKAVVELMRDPDRIALMRQGARDSAARYTVENMVEKMSNGIQTCLESVKRTT